MNLNGKSFLILQKMYPLKEKSLINSTLLYTFLFSSSEFNNFINNNSIVESAPITTFVVSLTNQRSEYE
jgi:hypothetical protein